VERTIANQEDEISEQQIGIRVFGRDPGYNPGDDNIVRSQARILRSKLETYFQGEGAGETLRIEIPKGSYVPVFNIYEPPGTSLAEPGDTLRVAVPTSRERHTQRLRWWVLVAWIAGCCLGAGVMVGLRPSPNSLVEEPPHFQQFWNSLLAQEQPLTFVAPDQANAPTSEVLGRNFSLADYLLRVPQVEWARREAELGYLRDLPKRNYTMMDAVSIVTRVSELASRRGRSIVVRYAREVNRRELSGGPVILLGTRASNPWIELYEARQNFSYVLEGGKRPSILRNRQPQLNEPGEYRQQVVEGMVEGYSTLLYRKGLNGRSPVLLLGGMSMEATEAGASLLLAPGLFEREVARLWTGDSPYFEAVVRSRNLVGTATSPQKVTTRIYSD
jgi:hypothetical protein